MIPNSLQTISEISIGLAGFSGLVVALRKNSGPLSDVQKYRLRVLFGMSFGAMILALLPDTFLNLGLPENRVWFWSCLALSAYSTTFLVWWIAASWRVAKVAPEIFKWSVFTATTTGHAVALLLQLMVVSGLSVSNAAGFFSIGLIWYLIHAAHQFIRMLFVLPKGSHND